MRFLSRPGIGSSLAPRLGEKSLAANAIGFMPQTTKGNTPPALALCLWMTCAALARASAAIVINEIQIFQSVERGLLSQHGVARVELRRFGLVEWRGAGWLRSAGFT